MPRNSVLILGQYFISKWALTKSSKELLQLAYDTSPKSVRISPTGITTGTFSCTPGRILAQLGRPPLQIVPSMTTLKFGKGEKITWTQVRWVGRLLNHSVFLLSRKLSRLVGLLHLWSLSARRTKQTPQDLFFFFTGISSGIHRGKACSLEIGFYRLLHQSRKFSHASSTCDAYRSFVTWADFAYFTPASILTPVSEHWDHVWIISGSITFWGNFAYLFHLFLTLRLRIYIFFGLSECVTAYFLHGVTFGEMTLKYPEWTTIKRWIFALDFRQFGTRTWTCWKKHWSLPDCIYLVHLYISTIPCHI